MGEAGVGGGVFSVSPGGRRKGLLVQRRENLALLRDPGLDAREL